MAKEQVQELILVSSSSAGRAGRCPHSSQRVRERLCVPRAVRLNSLAQRMQEFIFDTIGTIAT